MLFHLTNVFQIFTENLGPYLRENSEKILNLFEEIRGKAIENLKKFRQYLREMLKKFEKI